MSNDKDSVVKKSTPNPISVIIGVVIVVIVALAGAYIVMNNNKVEAPTQEEETEIVDTNEEESDFPDDRQGDIEFKEIENIDNAKESLEVGMSYDQVVEILGGEGRRTSRARIGEAIVSTYIWENTNEGQPSLLLDFSNDELRNIYQR